MGLLARSSSTSSKSDIDHCSDAMHAGPNSTFLAHNEDGAKLNFNTSYFVTATVLDADGEVITRFTAFAYPGVLPSSAFGFNSFGLAFTDNALHPVVRIGPGFVSQALLHRHMLEARS